MRELPLAALFLAFVPFAFAAASPGGSLGDDTSGRPGKKPPVWDDPTSNAIGWPKIRDGAPTPQRTIGPKGPNIIERGDPIFNTDPFPTNYPSCVMIQTQPGLSGWTASGILIGDRLVLTAKHISSTCPVNVLFGDGRGATVQIRVVDWKPYAPAGSDPPVAADLMLLFLGSNVPSNFVPVKIAPAAFMDANFRKGAEVTIAGFGTDLFGSNDRAGKKRKGKVKIDSPDCAAQEDAVYQGLAGYEFVASDPRGIYDTLNGDSGGPVYMFDGPQTPLLVGVTSRFDQNRGSISSKGIYTRADKFVGWIKAVASGWGQTIAQ